MRQVVVLSAQRTPIGKRGGALRELSAVDLGVHAAQAAIAQSGIPAEAIDQAIFGHVLAAGNGQNVSRQIALRVGLSDDSTAMTINQVCGSGLKAVHLGQAAIQLGEADAVLVGGTESMSNAPGLVRHNTASPEVEESLNIDGLTDAINHEPMGMTAERVADDFHISREIQDEFTLHSHQKAAAATVAGRFTEEITPIGLMAMDEGIRPDSSMAALGKLRTIFKTDGTVTAGNASGINDGAAALVLMAKDAAEAQGLSWLAELTAFDERGIDPAVMGFAPARVIPHVLGKAGWAADDVDLYELNEAFAAQSMAVVRALELPAEKVNVNGGALALGHPLGASGARILTTLIYALKQRQLHRGVAALCVGGGMAVGMGVTLPDD
ncbi:thiolase family protein [Schleiferilactobacillus harbinensis]|uniref:thiolase family protein n=1 Tax=Schleiferilactobacillus harbinensis TaxID=304207 RepID=UPI0011737C56|nr:acetyl-CoA C-acyltransferase [Schleiferilactobacillus harbinensis]GEK05383.1 acetyl-CoA acetyltransferase [Schleiferilactobacillus harbinensis]